MNHLVETGTDVAALVIYDPAVLPADFDQRPARERPASLRRLHEEQRVFHVQTGADGAYLVHAVVDEVIPGHLTPFIREPCVHDAFEVPSGRVYCVGLEYAFRSDDSRLTRHPQMGGHFAVDPGRYRLTVYRTEYPDGLMEDALRGEVGASACKLHQSMGCLVGLAVVSVVACVAAFFLLPAATWAAVVLPFAAVLLALPFVVPRLPACRKTEAVWQQVQRKYPSLVLELHRHTDP